MSEVSAASVDVSERARHTSIRSSSDEAAVHTNDASVSNSLMPVSRNIRFRLVLIFFATG